MGYFPFFMDIEGKKGLIIGGGAVAAWKVGKLLPFPPILQSLPLSFCRNY